MSALATLQYKTAAPALIGAGLGAGLGYLLSDDKDKWRNALAGAAVGGVGGHLLRGRAPTAPPTNTAHGAPSGHVTALAASTPAPAPAVAAPSPAATAAATPLFAGGAPASAPVAATPAWAAGAAAPPPAERSPGEGPMVGSGLVGGGTGRRPTTGTAALAIPALSASLGSAPSHLPTDSPDRGAFVAHHAPPEDLADQLGRLGVVPKGPSVAGTLQSVPGITSFNDGQDRQLWTGTYKNPAGKTVGAPAGTDNERIPPMGASHPAAAALMAALHGTPAQRPTPDRGQASVPGGTPAHLMDNLGTIGVIPQGPSANGTFDGMLGVPSFNDGHDRPLWTGTYKNPAGQTVKGAYVTSQEQTTMTSALEVLAHKTAFFGGGR